MNPGSSNGYDILVTGADQRPGLAIIRALGREGVRVFAAGAERWSIGFYSSYSRGSCRYPSSFEDKQRFVQSIAEAVARHRIPVVFPTGESAAIAMDEHREQIEPLARLMLAPRAALHIALDKKRTLELARSLGVPTPATCIPATGEEALDFAASVGYPVVLKPRAMPSFQGAEGTFRFKVRYARDEAELRRELESCSQGGVYPLLQSYAPGVKAQLGVLRAGGEFLGIYQWKGEREYPLTGGITCLHVSVRPDPDLLRWSQSLLEAMDWEGLAGVEFRVDERTGAKQLMEVNGRPWASISGAIGLGLNFPYAYYRYVADGTMLRLPAEYPLGVRHRYLRGDLTALLMMWRDRSLRYIPGYPRPLRVLTDVLKDFRPAVQSESFARDDLIPALADCAFLPYDFARYALRKLWPFSRNAAR